LDLSRYRVGLRLVLNACIAMSRFPDVITANSAAGLKSHLRLGYRPRRADVIANGIDVDRFRPDAAARAAVRDELGISSEAIVVAHVARVDPMKGHDTFLPAMTALPEARALLIGAGTENLPAAPNVARLGGREDVARLLAASDIVVSSSAFGEGFSNALAEGMACGLPAVATDVGDAALIVGDAGLIVPPNDPPALGSAIRQLAREGAEARAKRSLRARTHIVENFRMERALERYAELYASLGSARD
jgi:glycosyltransferase involved in cell wall biosynthesis